MPISVYVYIHIYIHIHIYVCVCITISAAVPSEVVISSQRNLRLSNERLDSKRPSWRTSGPNLGTISQAAVLPTRQVGL